MRCLGRIGVFGGGARNDYLLQNILSNPELWTRYDDMQITAGNLSDFVTSLVSYKLGLSGPSVNVQTACSTSLVAVHQAVQSLLLHECDVALAGGVAVHLPQRQGYLYQDGGVLSSDGHCRAFDARADGCVPGNGAGIVVLKRAGDALRDGNWIHALIRGSAVNNDGSLRAGFTAPSVDGQAECIAEALSVGGIQSESIGFLEGHGTGTKLGDPIEVAALTQAFATERRAYCALGSLKSNLGHLDAAAGVAGLIKAVLAVEHGKIPPSLNFDQPNPELKLSESPFFVNTQLIPWDSATGPRRAGVSSFGIGGTNVHVVVEQAPSVAVRSPAAASGIQTLLLSAKTPSALKQSCERLAKHIETTPEHDLAQISATLQVGRRPMPYRQAVRCGEPQQAVRRLRGHCEEGVRHGHCLEPAKVVLLFPGQGTLDTGLGAELYSKQALFRQSIDDCAELLGPLMDVNPLDFLRSGNDLELKEQLMRTDIAQPILFMLEYALARMWIELGLRPAALLGLSLGEYVAACVAGVFSLRDAIQIVVKRGSLMQQLPEGRMLAVAEPTELLELRNFGSLETAVDNGDAGCVVSGTPAAIEVLQQQLHQASVACQLLETSRAFHSSLLEPMLEPLREMVAEVPREVPAIPYISNVTGTWIEPTQAVDPQYWVEQTRHTVRFAEGVNQVLQHDRVALLNCGPGSSMQAMIQPHAADRTINFIQCLNASKDSETDVLMDAAGELWIQGVEFPRPLAQANGHPCQRVPLPTYPFERQRQWIEPTKFTTPRSHSLAGRTSDNVRDWLYYPCWRQSPARAPLQVDSELVSGTQWLVFEDPHGFGSAIVKRLRDAGAQVTSVVPGTEFDCDDGTYRIRPADASHYERLLAELEQSGHFPERIVHTWSAAADPNEGVEESVDSTESFAKLQELGLYSFSYLARAIALSFADRSLSLNVVTQGLFRVTGDEQPVPARATILGPCLAAPYELPGLSCRLYDVCSDESTTNGHLDQLLAEFCGHGDDDRLVAFRHGLRWVRDHEKLTDPTDTVLPDVAGGVYLVTGGFHDPGLILAEWLVAEGAEAVILVEHRSHTGEAGALDDDAIHILREDAIRRFPQGSPVMTAMCDLSDRDELREVVARAEAQFGRISGLVHAADQVEGQVLALKTPESIARVLRPKAKAIVILDDLLREHPLDLVILCGSNGTALGCIGSSTACAGNAFLDALAQTWPNSHHSRVLAIDWPVWQPSGSISPASGESRRCNRPIPKNSVSRRPASRTSS